MKTKRLIAALSLWAALGFVGFFGARFLRTTLLADPERLMPIPDHSALLAAERQKPRFVGDIAGIFLAPRGEPVPEHYVTYEDVCDSQPAIEVSPQRAGMLALPLKLPSEYILVEDSLNTGVIACGNTVSGARWQYDGPRQSTGIVPYIVIGRSLFTHDEIDVAVDRPTSTVIGGREAVVLEALTPDGYDQHARAWFPEPFGYTFIQATDLPHADFMTLAELVASATR